MKKRFKEENYIWNLLNKLVDSDIKMMHDLLLFYIKLYKLAIYI